jgi:hypothetical protein
LEILRRLGFESHRLSGDWMGERKDGCVKRLAPQLVGNAAELRVPNRLSIERISEDRVPVLGEMHPNLMRSPGLETATHQSASVQKLD